MSKKQKIDILMRENNALECALDNAKDDLCKELEEAYSVIRKRNAEIESLKAKLTVRTGTVETLIHQVQKRDEELEKAKASDKWAHDAFNKVCDNVTGLKAIIEEQNKEISKWRDEYEAEVKLRGYLEGLVLTAMKE